MQIAVKSKCPCCDEMVGHLSPWAPLWNKMIHICDECIRVNKSQGDVFKIGFIMGAKHAAEKMEEFIRKERGNDG